MIVTSEELKAMIWKRYGNFELSHEKNVGIVENIFDFITEQRVEFAKLHVKAALKAANKTVKNNIIHYSDLERKPNIILNSYPDSLIQ